MGVLSVWSPAVFIHIPFLTVCLSLYVPTPPYYAARRGHRHQWGPNRSLGRLERGAHKSAVASLSVLSVHYLCSRVVWLDLSTLKCVFVSRSEIYWPHFLPSKPSHRYTFILMLHFHYQMLSKALKHHPNTDLLLTYFDYMIRDLLKALN